MKRDVLLAAIELSQGLKNMPTHEAVILFGSAVKKEMHKKSNKNPFSFGFMNQGEKKNK